MLQFNSKNNPLYNTPIYMTVNGWRAISYRLNILLLANSKIVELRLALTISYRLIALHGFLVESDFFVASSLP